MLLKSLLSMLLVFCMIFFGCDKKKGKEAEKIDDAEVEALASGEESDDIFDEFYDETKEGTSESPTEDFSTSSSVPQFNPDGRYVVQVSCVLSKGLAQDVVSQLENKGYPAYIAEVENPTPELIGLYQRIRIGGFNGISQAKDFAESHLVQEGYEYWVDNRSNDHIGMGGNLGLGESSSGYESASTPEPATTTTSEDWGTPAPTTTTTSDDWGTSQPTTTPAAPPAEESVPAPVTTETTTPAPTTTETTTPPPQPTPSPESTTKPSGDEWGDVEEEWGSDTTGW